MVGDHGALVAVEGDAGVVERLLRVAQTVIKFRYVPVEDAAEIARNQRPSDRCNSIFWINTKSLKFKFKTDCSALGRPRGKRWAWGLRRPQRTQWQKRPTTSCRSLRCAAAAACSVRTLGSQADQSTACAVEEPAEVWKQDEGGQISVWIFIIENILIIIWSIASELAQNYLKDQILNKESSTLNTVSLHEELLIIDKRNYLNLNLRMFAIGGKIKILEIKFHFTFLNIFCWNITSRNIWLLLPRPF